MQNIIHIREVCHDKAVFTLSNDKGQYLSFDNTEDEDSVEAYYYKINSKQF